MEDVINSINDKIEKSKELFDNLPNANNPEEQKRKDILCKKIQDLIDDYNKLLDSINSLKK